MTLNMIMDAQEGRGPLGCNITQYPSRLLLQLQNCWHQRRGNRLNVLFTCAKCVKPEADVLMADDGN